MTDPAVTIGLCDYVEFESREYEMSMRGFVIGLHKDPENLLDVRNFYAQIKTCLYGEYLFADVPFDDINLLRKSSFNHRLYKEHNLDITDWVYKNIMFNIGSDDKVKHGILTSATLNNPQVLTINIISEKKMQGLLNDAKDHARILYEKNFVGLGFDDHTVRDDFKDKFIESEIGNYINNPINIEKVGRIRTGYTISIDYVLSQKM